MSSRSRAKGHIGNFFDGAFNDFVNVDVMRSTFCDMREFAAIIAFLGILSVVLRLFSSRSIAVGEGESFAHASERRTTLS